MPTAVITRRAIIAGAGLLLPLPAFAAVPAGGRLRFAVFRNGVRVGDHEMGFTRAGDDLTVTTQVAMSVKLGPVPVYRYSHRARELWRGGRFSSLETSTSSNGKVEQVTARRSGDSVAIETLKGMTTAPARASPLTHWNSDAFAGPLFNPQTGSMLKVTANRSGDRWLIRGETEIDDSYDEAGVWIGLRGRLKDKSVMEYRRLG